MLTDAEKVEVRRFCGYPMFGGQPVQAFGYRFFQHYGTLEFRMNNMLADEEDVIRDKFLTNLSTLETAVLSTTENLDTAKAAVWEHNKNEMRDREALLSNWRMKLCQFIGVPPGPGLNEVGFPRVI
jgi:hypothetical protein